MHQDEISQGFSVKLEAGDLALGFPEVAVGVEDSMAEEVFEIGDDFAAFRVALEVVFKDVLYVCWICGEDGTIISCDAEDESL